MLLNLEFYFLDLQIISYLPYLAIVNHIKRKLPLDKHKIDVNQTLFQITIRVYFVSKVNFVPNLGYHHVNDFIEKVKIPKYTSCTLGVTCHRLRFSSS